MKIVVLNECFLKENHLKKLRDLGEVEIFDDTDSEEKAIDRIKNADIVLMDQFIATMNATVLDSTADLKLIVLNTVGFDLVDLQAAKEKNVRVTNLPGVNTEAVAEHVIALMFAVLRKIPFADQDFRKKPFEADPANVEQQKYKGTSINGKIFGIIGMGNIGQRVAELAKGLGMKVIAFNRTPKEISEISFVSMEEVLKKSDVVSVNLSLSPELENIISKDQLSLMKSSAVLINAARGKHINSEDLYQALVNGKIQGAGLDVVYPTSKENPLLELDNVVFTPHIGWYTEETLEKTANMMVENVEAFVKGEPINVVN